MTKTNTCIAKHLIQLRFNKLSKKIAFQFPIYQFVLFSPAFQLIHSRLDTIVCHYVHYNITN